MNSFLIVYKFKHTFLTIGTMIDSHLCKLKDHQVQELIRRVKSGEPTERQNAAKRLLHLFNAENWECSRDQHDTYVFVFAIMTQSFSLY